MDPVSILGVAGSVVSIIAAIARNVSALSNLQAKYRNADLSVLLLIGQLSTLKAALSQISVWISIDLTADSQHEQLIEDLTVSLSGCGILIQHLDARMEQVNRNNTIGLTAKGKLGFLWVEQDMTTYLSLLNNQINALNLLLSAINCQSHFQQRTFLQSDESRRLMKQVKDDASSLILLRDANSIYSSRSDSTRSPELLDTIFDFDREIFNSSAYRGALRSNMKKALSQKNNTHVQHHETSSAADHNRILLDSGDYEEDSQTIKTDAMKPLPTHYLSSKRSAPFLTSYLDPGMNSTVLTETVKEWTKGHSWYSVEITDSETKALLEEVKSSLPISDNVTETTRDIRASTKPKKQVLSGLLKCRRAQELRRERDEHCKTLVLGNSGSGKSTLLKSLELVVGDGYSVDDRESFKEIIFSNTIQSMRVVLAAMDDLEIPLEDESHKCHVETISMQPAQVDGDSWEAEIINAIKFLLEDNGVQECIRRSAEYNLPDGAVHFFSNIRRISDSSYIPLERDILLCSTSRSTGLLKTTFPAAVGQYHVYDVGGRRSERKKWIHVFPRADSLIFTVDIACYDELLVEDEKVNRMHDALMLFDSIANSKWFKTTPMILFFTKCDKLGPKLQTSPLKNYFKDLDENWNDVEAAKAIISNMFLSRYRRGEREIKVRFISITENQKSLGQAAAEFMDRVMEQKRIEEG